MKKVFLTGLFFVAVQAAFSQSASLKQNNQWLEKNLNALVGDKDKSKDNVNPVFRFNDCDAKMEIGTKTDGGFNFGMNFGTTLDQIERVSYQKEDKGYKLNLHMKPDKDEKENGGKMDFSLSTSDENMMKEIKKRLETSIAACKSMKKP